MFETIKLDLVRIAYHLGRLHSHLAADAHMVSLDCTLRAGAGRRQAAFDQRKVETLLFPGHEISQTSFGCGAISRRLAIAVS